MNLLSSSLRFVFRSPLLVAPKFTFSEFFREKDMKDVFEYNDRKVRNKKYRALIDLWKKPLEKKRLRQARIKAIKQSLPTPVTQPQKLIVHNPVIGLRSPDANNLFAVVKVDTRQFKVTKDCMIILDTKPEHAIGQEIKFSQVLMIGTDSYTALGRPKVENAEVAGVVESISMSEKIIVFKKKRRKQYKKSFGSRVSLTSVRITNVVHNLTKDILERAVPLQ